MGIKISEYDEMTPHQLNLIIQVYDDKKKAEDEEKLTLTYLGAYWQRVKKMPSLKQLLGKEQPKETMTPEDILNKIKQLNTAFGGTIY